MKRWIQTFWEMLKVFVLFTGFTILFYYAIILINQEYEEYHKYDQPKGAALKVTKMLEEKEENFLNRLIFFYLHGE